MTQRRSVTIISPDVSANLMVRAFELTRLLSEDFRVQIVGHGSAAELWRPLAGRTDFTLRTFEVPTFLHLVRSAPAISRDLIEGDLLIALGGRPVSFGLGLIARRVLARPLLLDNHEWEVGFVSDSVLRETFRRPFPGHLLRLRSGPFTHLMDKLAGRADAMLVTSRFLQQIYGGYWLPHVRDSVSHLTPPGEALGRGRQVLYVGTVYAEGIVPPLLEAWRQVDVPDARLRIVGAVNPSQRSELLELADDRVSFEDPVPIDEVPRLLAEAAVVAVPQRRDYPGVLPSKLIEAMAHGRAIVATSVGDIGEWLADGAGLAVPPDRPDELARALRELLSEPERAARMGRCARERFLRLASVEAHRPRLVEFVSRLISGAALPEPWEAFREPELSRGTVEVEADQLSTG